MRFSEDQADAYDVIVDVLKATGIDLDNALLKPERLGKQQTLAVLGKAGSGKTMLLAKLGEALTDVGVDTISGDYEGKAKKGHRTLAILAPTNKAASVLRNRGVKATTIHRILYTPMYDPEYENIAEWLAGNAEKPKIDGLTDVALERAFVFFQSNQSVPGALAVAGLMGSDFIIGWKRRE